MRHECEKIAVDILDDLDISIGDLNAGYLIVVPHLLYCAVRLLRGETMDDLLQDVKQFSDDATAVWSLQSGTHPHSHSCTISVSQPNSRCAV